MEAQTTVTGYYLIVLLGWRGIIGSYLYDLTGWSIVFIWWAAVIAAAVMALPLMVKSARAAIESVNPKYEIASYTLGKGRRRPFSVSRCCWRDAASSPESC
ncbi:MAG: hypothetical protein MOB07_09875 [Acidobacteria bacterium]|nr:hypothetical protein [Acidobacteriota bacterium]